MASLITSNTASTDISIHSQTARTASLNHSNWLYAQITAAISAAMPAMINVIGDNIAAVTATKTAFRATNPAIIAGINPTRSEEHTSELQSRGHLVCRLLLEKKKPLLY